MTLLLGDIVPDFTAETAIGPISFHEWIGNEWAIVPPSMSNAEALAKFPQGFEEIRPYLRTVNIDAAEFEGIEI